MKERPILFSGPMVRAILDGKKTQTRRIVKGKGTWSVEDADPCRLKWPGFENEDGDWCDMPCPYGSVGDRLWVRETLRQKPNSDYSNSPHTSRTDWVYAADDKPIKANWVEMAGWSVHRSKPSIHMPRWASRITLEITGVRVERLNEISEEDARAEGVQKGMACDDYTHVGHFRSLWESINGKDSWSANPWVWVIEFQKVNK